MTGPLRMAMIYTQTQLTGLTSRYSGSLGLARSMMTSSYGNPSSLITMCARCAYGQPWLVYRVILGVFPLVAAILLRIWKMRGIVC